MRRRRVVVGAALGSAALGLAWQTGWGRGERPFAAATGWDAVAAELRPAPGLSWPADAGAAPRLGWLGHAGLVVEWHGVRLAFDPNLSPRCTIVRRELERPIEPEELGAFDAVAITHAHFDHLDRPTVERLSAVERIVLPRGSERYVAGWRRDSRVVGLGSWESVRIGALELVAVPALHHGNRYHPLASAKLAVGWIVRAGAERGGATLYVAGDSGRANDFAAIGRAFRPTLAVLPIGAFLPPWPIGRVHLSPEQAVDVARELGARVVVPYHFGTFALALDRPAAALPRFARAAHAAATVWALPELIRESSTRAPRQNGAG